MHDGRVRPCMQVQYRAGSGGQSLAVAWLSGGAGDYRLVPHGFHLPPSADGVLLRVTAALRLRITHRDSGALATEGLLARFPTFCQRLE